MANLEHLPRSKLQKLAKKNGIKANQKTSKLVELLLRVLSSEEVANVQLKDLDDTTNVSLDITNLTQNNITLNCDTTNVTFDADKLVEINETKENETNKTNLNQTFDANGKTNETERAEKSLSEEKSSLNETFDVSHKILNSSSTPKKKAISEFLTDDDQTVSYTTNDNNSKSRLNDMSFGNVSVLSNFMTDDENTSLIVNHTSREQNDRLKEVTVSKVIEENKVEDANLIGNPGQSANTSPISLTDLKNSEEMKSDELETQKSSSVLNEICEQEINNEQVKDNEELCVEQTSVQITNNEVLQKNRSKKKKPLISAPRQPTSIANTVTFENWSNSQKESRVRKSKDRKLKVEINKKFQKQAKNKTIVKVPKDEVRRSPRINSMCHTPDYKVGRSVSLKRKRSKTPAKKQQTLPKLSPVKKIIQPVTAVSNHKKTKIIDFQKLYERKMAKVESIDDHEKRKQARRIKMSATKPERPKIDNSNAKRTKLFESKLKTPKPAVFPRKKAQVGSSLQKSLNSKIFKPTKTTTKNMKIEFAETSRSYQFKSAKEQTKKLETPKNNSIQKRTMENKPDSLLKQKQVARLSSTPFKLGSGGYVASPKTKFNLKESLKKKLTYKPHTGPLKQYSDTTVKPIRRQGAKERSIASSNMKKLQKWEVQKSKRNNAVMKRRGLK